MSELINNSLERKLKEIILKLHNGESEEQGNTQLCIG